MLQMREHIHIYTYSYLSSYADVRYANPESKTWKEIN